MAVTFDPRKSVRNVALGRPPFDAVERMEWREALVSVARIQEPTATRYHAVGRIDGQVHVVIFTFEGAAIRIVSLRRAGKNEDKLWRSTRQM